MGNKGSRSKKGANSESKSDLRHNSGHAKTHTVQAEVHQGADDELPAISAATAVRIACLLGWIEAHELHKTEFLYRSNGSQLNVASLVDAALAFTPSQTGDSLLELQRLRAELRSATPHCIACAVKQIFHRCEALVPADHYEEMVQLFASPLGPEEVSAAALRLKAALSGEGVWLLPVLLLHLHQVQQHAGNNHMQSKALATVFGPVLLRYPPPNPLPGDAPASPEDIMRQHSTAAIRSNTSLNNLLDSTPALLQALGHPWAQLEALARSRAEYRAGGSGQFAPLPMAPLLPPPAALAVPRLLQEAEEWDTWQHASSGQSAPKQGGEGGSAVPGPKPADEQSTVADGTKATQSQFGGALAASHDSAASGGGKGGADAEETASQESQNSPGKRTTSSATLSPPAALHVPSLPAGEVLFEDSISPSPSAAGGVSGGVPSMHSPSAAPSASFALVTLEGGEGGPSAGAVEVEGAGGDSAEHTSPGAARIESEDLGGKLTVQGPPSIPPPPSADTSLTADSCGQSTPAGVALPLKLLTSTEQGSAALVPTLAIQSATENTAHGITPAAAVARRDATAPHPEHTGGSGRTGFSWDEATSVASGSREVSDTTSSQVKASSEASHGSVNEDVVGLVSSTVPSSVFVLEPGAGSKVATPPQARVPLAAESPGTAVSEHDSASVVTSDGDSMQAASPPRRGGKTALLRGGHLTTLDQLAAQVQASRSRRAAYAKVGVVQQPSPPVPSSESDAQAVAAPACGPYSRAPRAVAWAESEGGGEIAISAPPPAQPHSPPGRRMTPLQQWANSHRAQGLACGGTSSVSRLYASRQYARLASAPAPHPPMRVYQAPPRAGSTALVSTSASAVVRYNLQNPPRRAEEGGGLSSAGGHGPPHSTPAAAPVILGGVDLSAMAARWNV